MSQSPDPAGGPSRSTPAPGARSGADHALIRQFVMEYLQSHGFDRALQTFNEMDQPNASAPGGGAGSGTGAGAASGGDGEDGAVPAGEREAVVLAPPPIALESAVKRNIPQAQALSASTMADKITPEFEAQARYIIEQLTKRAEAAATVGAGGDDAEEKELKDGLAAEGSLLDTSDRVKGYGSYLRWVDGGLDMWKAELDNLSYPLFVHTFLELIHFGFLKSARDFFHKHHIHHQPFHPQDISSLASVSTKDHIKANSLCQRMVTEKYTVPLSRNANDLLLQWLSGASLDEEWEAGLHSASGRAKEAIKGILYKNINISVSNSSAPLDKATIASKSGMISSALPVPMDIDTFNTATTLKLGPAPMTEKLKEQVTRTLQDDDAAAPSAGGSQGPNGTANGHAGANGHTGDADVDMTSPHLNGADADGPSVTFEIKTELDAERDPSLVSPEEGETLPPIPAVFKIPDLKREVEAVKDRRKMIRLGPGAGAGGAEGAAVLPSVVAFTLFDHGESASSVEFSKDSSLMGVGSSESCVRLWSLSGEKLKKKFVDPLDGSLVEDEGLPMRKLIGHSGPVYSLSFDPIYGSSSPPSTLLSSSQDGSIRLWSLDTYSNLVVYRGHGKDPVWDVEWGPLGVYFASASRDRTARLWSSDRVAPLRMYTGHLSDVNCVKFHPNSLYLATGSNDTTCRLWDVQRGACIRLFMGHTDAVTTTAISPDGKILASAGLDTTIRLWDLGSSRVIKQMTGHTAPITSLSFSAESSTLVSSSLDSTVRCWDVKSAGGQRSGGGEGGIFGGDARRGGVEEQGALPMGPGDVWDKTPHTADLLATWPTKRTPVLKTHYTPRNLCMVAGSFIPPSSTGRGLVDAH
ncbi:hypothetical protein IAT38_000920 [Cryptococcus sp. DSM 104549]